MSLADFNQTLELFEKLKAASVVSAACNLKLFDHLVSGEQTAEKLCEDQGWDQINTKRLLDALVSLNYLKKNNEQGTYSLTSAGQLLAQQNFPTLFGLAEKMGKLFGNLSKLPEEVKTASRRGDALYAASNKGDAKDAPSKDSHDHHHNIDILQQADTYKMFDSLGSLYADDLVRAFDLSEHKSAVDLGGGSGCMSRALVKAYPNMAVSLCDRPNVIKIVQEKFMQPNIKIHLLEGDFMEMDLPNSDLYLLSKIVHDWRPDQVDLLLSKIYKSTNTGGGIILMEKCLNDTKDGPYQAHTWDMMVMSHCGGGLRSGKEYTDLLNKHGFTQVQIHKTDPMCSFDVIYGRKLNSE